MSQIISAPQQWFYWCDNCGVVFVFLLVYYLRKKLISFKSEWFGGVYNSNVFSNNRPRGTQNNWYKFEPALYQAIPTFVYFYIYTFMISAVLIFSLSNILKFVDELIPVRDNWCTVQPSSIFELIRFGHVEQRGEQRGEQGVELVRHHLLTNSCRSSQTTWQLW